MFPFTLTITSHIHTNHLPTRPPSMIIGRIISLVVGLILPRSSFTFTIHPPPKQVTSLSAKVQPLPDINFGLTDDEFQSWLTSQIENVPGRATYSKVYQDAIQAIVNWRKRYRGNPVLWKRIFKKERVIKELIESAPVIYAMQELVEAHESDDEKFTIVDLCCGKGYLSMFLSECLDKEKVAKCILIDKAWPMCNAELKPHHMNWDHIYGPVPDSMDVEDESYFTTWPIPLHTSKQDLKQSSNPRQMKKYIFDRIDGPIIILAVHLCGTLSLKAVDMFNNHNNVKFFALKPCCLPGMVYAQRDDIFKIGQHEFDSKEVCSNGSFNKKDWNGPPRWHLENKFHLWADHLFKGVDIGDVTVDREDDRIVCLSNDGTKEKREITVQVKGGYQNTYLFAERSPLTPQLWDKSV